uniref:Uncharacterized protein n=1 Tax=Musca domestica TaxID=7370 RepID=A0A1I8NED7_MUSDO
MESKSITYLLYKYREQLRQKEHEKSTLLRLSRTKLTITDKLIKTHVSEIKKCSTEDVLAISRNIVFQSKLKQQIQRLNQTKRLATKK